MRLLEMVVDYDRADDALFYALDFVLGAQFFYLFAFFFIFRMVFFVILFLFFFFFYIYTYFFLYAGV